MAGTAKSELFVRLEYLNVAINLPELIDVGLVSTEHNEVANLLRKGLGIVAFNILEDYIKNRCVECLDLISISTIDFNDLTEKLQEHATLGAIKALVFRTKTNDGSDWKRTIQDESAKIHSTLNVGYQLSNLALVSSQSNISYSDINTILEAFGIKGGWTTIKSVSDAIGGGLPDLSQAYKNISSRRHSSAHTAAFRYEYSWISTVKDEILAIAASLDILLTARCRQVNANPRIKLDAHLITNALRYKFLQPRSDIFLEKNTLTGRSRRNWPNLLAAKTVIVPTLVANNEFLIILNSSRRIDDWITS